MKQNKSVTFQPASSFPSAQNASDPLRFNMTNDYMFRATLQTNNKEFRLDHEQEYNEIQPVIHIGFLDNTLFKESPEFYATYKLINVKIHEVYSDSLVLSMVNLSRIDLATDEDKKYQLDYWARLFKAATRRKFIC